MPRIIAGIRKGINLAMPKNKTRPLTQRTKESLFQIIEFNYFSFSNLNILDLFAGSGSIGLEAISRGAKNSTFVEMGESQISVLKKNIIKVDVEKQSKIIKKKVEKFLSESLKAIATANIDSVNYKKIYNIIFLDPPFNYQDKEVNEIIKKCDDLLEKNGLIIVHRSKYSLMPKLSNKNIRILKYGDSRIYIYQNKLK